MVTQSNGGTEGCILNLELSYNNNTYVISNVYGPNGDQPMFYIQLYNLLMEFSTDNILIGGVLNVVLNSDLDKVGGDKTLSHAAETLYSLMDEFNFTDIHRHFHPYTMLFT